MGILGQLDIIMSRGYCGSNIHLVNLRFRPQKTEAFRAVQVHDSALLFIDLDL